MSASDLVETIRLSLREHANPAIAPAQQAYMKSALPFFGVKVPQVRALTKNAAVGERDADVLRAAAEVLWREATHREERYAALALIALRPLRARLDMIEFYEEIISTGAWWDVVDEAASRVGEVLRAHPVEVTQVMLMWSAEDDMWLRRASIISQLKRRADTDLDLLTIAIESNIEDTEFFIRKAIGWALRTYAKTDPDWVRAFVDSHPELSGLSRREAFKHLD